MAITKQKSTLASAYGLPASGQTFSGSGGTPMAKPPRPTYAGTTGTGQAYANSGLPYQGSGGGAGIPAPSGVLGMGGGPGLGNPGVQTRLDEYGRMQYLDAMSGQWYYPSPQQQAQSGAYTNEYGQFNGDGTVGLVAGPAQGYGPDNSGLIQNNPGGNVGSVVVGSPEWWAKQQPPPPPPPPPLPESQKRPPGQTPDTIPTFAADPPPPKQEAPTGKPKPPANDQNPLRPGENPMLRNKLAADYGLGSGITYGEDDWKKPPKRDSTGTGQDGTTYGGGPKPVSDANSGNTTADYPRPPGPIQRGGDPRSDAVASSGLTPAQLTIMSQQARPTGNTSGITYGEHNYPGGPGQKQEALPWWKTSPDAWKISGFKTPEEYDAAGRPQPFASIPGGEYPGAPRPGTGTPDRYDPMPGQPMPGVPNQWPGGAPPPMGGMQLPPAWGTDPAYADYIAYQHQQQWANDPEYQKFQQWKTQYYKPKQQMPPDMGTTLNGSPMSQPGTAPTQPDQPVSWLPSTGANGQPLPRRLDMLRQYGLNLPQTTVQASTGQTLGPNAGGQQFTGLGGGTLPSGQTLANMDQTERSVYQGYVEGPVGMPWSSAVQAITQPTQHLQQARPAQRQV